MDKTFDFRLVIYYLSCFAFLVVIVVILIIGCIFTTPTNSDNQPYQTRIGLLDKFILETQFSLFITEFIYTVLLFIPNFYCSVGLHYKRTGKGSVYPVLVVGQRFVENEHLTNRNGSSNYYYLYKKLLCFYIEFVVSQSFAVKIGLGNKSEKNKERETTTESKGEASRITIVEQVSSSPLQSGD